MKAKATKENGKFYPLVQFSGYITDSFIINYPQETRAKAVTIARNRIKAMQQRGIK
jgi:hypothetical protein